jgi:hypothetical protein
MLVEPIKQCRNQPSTRELLAEQPQRRAVGNVILNPTAEETGERQPVTHLILDLLVRQIVQRLQDQHAEHHHRIKWFAARLAFLRLFWREHHSLDVSAKTLPRHQRGNRFQRIALLPSCPIASLRRIA